MEPSDPPPATLQPRNNPLENQLVVAHIFQYLDHEELHCANLVSRLWNGVAAPILANHHKFSRIFHYLAVADLKHLRLVSKEWKLRADKALRKRAKIVLRDNDHVSRFLAQFDTQGSLPKYFAALELSTNVDLGQYQQLDALSTHIVPNVTWLKLARSKWTMSQLRRIMLEPEKSRLQELTIVSGMLPGTRSKKERDRHNPRDRLLPEKVKPIFANKSWRPPQHPTLVKLRKLSIDMNLADPVTGEPRFKAREFVGDLLDIVPNLEHLDIASRKIVPFVFDYILTAENVKFSRLSNVSTLLFNGWMTGTRLQQLENKHFPLKTINLWIQDKKVDPDPLFSLIGSLHTSLRHLGLAFSGTAALESPAATEFPRSISSKLTNLTSFRFYGDDQAPFSQSYDFISDFSALECLELVKVDLKRFKFDGDKVYPKTSLFNKLKQVKISSDVSAGGLEEDPLQFLDKAPFQNLNPKPRISFKAIHTVQQPLPMPNIVFVNLEFQV